MSDNQKQIVGTRIIKTALIVLGCLIIMLVTFWSGMMIGFRKASFNYQWGRNYQGLFEENEHRFPRDLRGMGFMNAHSATGSVIKVDTSTLIIKGSDGIEKNILIGNNTLIRRFQNTISPADIKVDDQVVVLGVPSTTGQIEARFIRVMPQP